RPDRRRSGERKVLEVGGRAERPARVADYRIDAAAVGLDHVAGRDDVSIVAVAAVERIDARAAVERVVARREKYGLVRDDAVVAVAPHEQVGVARSLQEVVARAADERVAARRAVHGLRGRAARHAIRPAGAGDVLDSGDGAR